jgi:hypothetical protein
MVLFALFFRLGYPLLHDCRFVAVMRFEISITIVISGHLSILIWFESGQKCGKFLRTLEDIYTYIYSFREPWKEVKMKSLEWQYILNVVMLLPLTMFHTWQPLQQIVGFSRTVGPWLMTQLIPNFVLSSITMCGVYCGIYYTKIVV